MKECEAEIISAEKTDDGGSGAILLEFDRTVFFPTGGGQSCDRGQVLRVALNDILCACCGTIGDCGLF